MNQFIEVQKVALREGEELMDFVRAVQMALRQQGHARSASPSLQGVYNGAIVTRDMESGKFFQHTVKREDGGTVELGEPVEVRQVWVPVDTQKEDDKDEGKAEWSTAMINDLPDASFLYIAPGGQKDDQGKTTPRSLRYFPVKDADGNVDLPHLRNALARIPQADIPQEAKDAAKAKAQQMLEEASKTEKRDAIVVLKGSSVYSVADGDEFEFIREGVRVRKGLWDGVL